MLCVARVRVNARVCKTVSLFSVHIPLPPIKRKKKYVNLRNTTLLFLLCGVPTTGEKENVLTMYQIIDFFQIFKRTNERKSI